MSTLETTRPKPGSRPHIDPSAMSHYLGLRHLPSADLNWVSGVAPTPVTPTQGRIKVTGSDDIVDALESIVRAESGLGLLLSGGIDSAILAALVPPNTPCFTIVFDAPGALDESVAAAAYAARWGHPHTVVRVRWHDYVAGVVALFTAKNSPLHAIEVPLHLAAREAKRHGVKRLLVGNGADSNFGGMDKLLSVDWSFEDFMARYLFADPATLLVDPVDLTHVFEPYRAGDGVDVARFLHEVHGPGISAAFDNAISVAGLCVSSPYEQLILDAPLDLERIRAGEPKYLLQEAFRLLYDTDEVPPKVPFARPMDIWLRGWDGPKNRPEFAFDASVALRDASGEARWLTWCLAAFCEHLDGLSYE